MIGFPSETKDLTWVLERPCPECGMDTTALSGSDVAPLIRSAAEQWAETLMADPDPAP